MAFNLSANIPRHVVGVISATLFAAATVTDSQFLRNRAEAGFGGVFSGDQRSSWTITRCNFEFNRAQVGGRVRPCVGCALACIRLDDTHVDIECLGAHSFPRFLRVFNKSGGAVFFGSSSFGSMVDVTFNRNSAEENGGALAFEEEVRRCFESGVGKLLG